MAEAVGSLAALSKLSRFHREPFLLKSLPPGMSLLLTPPARVWCPGSEQAGENADGRLAAHCTPARHLEEPLGEPSSGPGPSSLTEMAASSGPGGVSRGRKVSSHPGSNLSPEPWQRCVPRHTVSLAQRVPFLLRKMGSPQAPSVVVTVRATQVDTCL